MSFLMKCLLTFCLLGVDFFVFDSFLSYLQYGGLAGSALSVFLTGLAFLAFILVPSYIIIYTWTKK